MIITRITRVIGTSLKNSCPTGAFILQPSFTKDNCLSCGVKRFNHGKGKPLYKTQEAKKIRFYVVEKYLEYLKKLQCILEKRFPAAMRVYKLFMEGVYSFMSDTKDYFKIIRMLNTPGKHLSNLRRTEIELYDQMPKDMKRVAPLLIITALPFGTAILPFVYLFPRQLLCSHFWSLQQKFEFQTLALKHRLSHNRPVFRHLQSQMHFLKCNYLYQEWKEVLGMLGSGVHPTVQQIVHCKELFMTEPYHLFYISHNHVIHLLKMHGMTGWFFQRSRLAERACILKEMDKAILREGGIENLPNDALKKACYIRGLNPTNLKNEEMTKYLSDWIHLSSHINKDCYSLLLHAPILLAYNSSSNWLLIYEKKEKRNETV